MSNDIKKTGLGVDDILSALTLLADLTTALRRGAEASAEITAIVAAAQKEDRKVLTPEEWAKVLGGATEARDRLGKLLGQ
jgi:hypothetical protein